MGFHATTSCDTREDGKFRTGVLTRLSQPHNSGQLRRCLLAVHSTPVNYQTLELHSLCRSEQGRAYSVHFLRYSPQSLSAGIALSNRTSFMSLVTRLRKSQHPETRRRGQTLAKCARCLAHRQHSTSVIVSTLHTTKNASTDHDQHNTPKPIYDFCSRRCVLSLFSAIPLRFDQPPF